MSQNRKKTLFVRPDDIATLNSISSLNGPRYHDVSSALPRVQSNSQGDVSILPLPLMSDRDSESGELASEVD